VVRHRLSGWSKGTRHYGKTQLLLDRVAPPAPTLMVDAQIVRLASPGCNGSSYV
jgi:hypothetical protein